jgi:lambda family phage holin
VPAFSQNPSEPLIAKFSEGLIRTCVLPLAEFIRPFYSALPEREERRTITMPEKNPDFWAQVWLVLSTPLWQGAIMAITVSLLRVLYDAKETSKRRILFESLICGSLSLVASSVIEWMEWPPSLSVAAGGTIGFLGVTAIRELVTRFLGRKADAI